MRKHNHRFAQRYTRGGGDRSNFPQSMAHSLANNKAFQLATNPLILPLIKRGTA